MSDGFTRRLSVTALVIGPLSLIITTIMQWMLQPAGTDPTPVDVAQQFPTAWVVLGLLSVFGPAVMLAGLPAVAALAPGRGRMTTRVGVLVTGLGLATGIGHLAAFFSVYGGLAETALPGAWASAATAAADRETLGTILLIAFLVCYSLGPIVLTVGLRMARAVPVWVPVAAVITAAAGMLGGPAAGIVQLFALVLLWAPVIVAVARVVPQRQSARVSALP